MAQAGASSASSGAAWWSRSAAGGCPPLPAAEPSWGKPLQAIGQGHQPPGLKALPAPATACQPAPDPPSAAARRRRARRRGRWATQGRDGLLAGTDRLKAPQRLLDPAAQGPPAHGGPMVRSNDQRQGALAAGRPAGAGELQLRPGPGHRAPADRQQREAWGDSSGTTTARRHQARSRSFARLATPGLLGCIEVCEANRRPPAAQWRFAPAQAIETGQLKALQQRVAAGPPALKRRERRRVDGGERQGHQLGEPLLTAGQSQLGGLQLQQLLVEGCRCHPLADP